MANIDRELSQIKSAIYGREVRGSIHDGIDKINKESEDSKSKATEAHEVMESIMEEGFDNAALEANFEQKLDDKIANLQPEWTQFKEDTVSHLTSVDDKAFYSGLVLNKNTKPMMVLIDDDGNPAVMDVLKPVAEEEEIPITLAVITDRVKNNSVASLNLQQLKDLQKLGFEITSHTNTHKPLSSLTNQEQHEEIRLAKEWLQKNGFNHNFIVYPFGSADENTQSIAKQYVRGGVYIDYGQSRVNKPPLNQYRMERVYYNTESGDNRVQLVKDKIDEAIDDNGLLIVGMHCHYDNFSPEGLKECIRYAKQRDMPIVTLSESINFYGNIIDLPDFKVDASGEITSTKIGKYKVAPGSLGVNGNTPMSNFDEGTTLSSHTGGSSYEGMPVASSSIMSTHKPSSNYLSFQEVRVLSNGNVYRRFYDNSAIKWGEWEMEPKIYRRERTYDFGTIPANSCVRKQANSPAVYNMANKTITASVKEGDLPLGVMSDFSVNEGIASFTVCNVTNSDIVVGSLTFAETEIRL